ncbi:glycoside hydrolase family 43 protein [Nonomuraea sp. C10]|uniref:glycoside hydrolase family 43 protein n=1 Tax=Nonomuraea sp. C10 TaxID=2600577 RepID=UPI0011CE7675|nr:glycoside hydrolase family 43 protein [Nonomuraea sp. C10]TXK40529.1 family 43 glycosylhydrolase [Nonomuraea sp. C10]
MNPRVLAGALLCLLAACSTATPTGESMTFTNPVHDANFPDPGALRVGATWYAYGTNGGGANVPLLTSPDLVTWTPRGDVLPELGSWAEPGHTWAPEAIQVTGDRFALYYTARAAGTGRQCVGVATAARPEGPFRDDSDTPLVCQAGEGGSIDASPFRDADGALYLYWKNDGNAIGETTWLYGQRLTPDGLGLEGERVRLLANTAAWHGKVVEAPQLVRHEGRYYLFYSANAFDAAAYAVGYATCDTPLGPCHDAPENPILSSGEGAAGPGHSYLVTTPGGQTWLLYHAWPPDAIGSVEPGRRLWLDRVDWEDGKPIVRGPTATPQPHPA